MVEVEMGGAGAMEQVDDTVFGSLLRAYGHVDPSRRALAGLRNGTEWVELSYDALMQEIVTVSTNLSGLGLEQGDVLCLQLPNWTEAVVFTYAAARLGVVVCPITTIYRERELRFILERTNCKVLVCPSSYRGFDYASMARELADDVHDLRHVVCVGVSEQAGVLSSDVLRRGERCPGSSGTVDRRGRPGGSCVHLRDYRGVQGRHALACVDARCH